MKRILSLVLALSMVLGMVLPAGAAEVTEDPVPTVTEIPAETVPVTTDASTGESAEEPAEIPTEEPDEEPSEIPTEDPDVDPVEIPTEMPADGSGEIAVTVPPADENTMQSDVAPMATTASGTCGADLTWTLDDSGRLTISGNETFTWTDTSVKNNNGTVYKYTIRALAGSDMKTLSGCRNAGRTMARLSSQVLTSATKASSTSIKCQWTTSGRVTGYEVRFIANGEVFKTFTVGNCKTGVKTFTGLKSGQTYTIQVRTYLKVDGMGFYSDWSTAKNVTI